MPSVQGWLLGGLKPTWAEEEWVSAYVMRRSKLLVATAEGERVVPPPYLRAHLAEAHHGELGHVGAPRVLTSLREVYWWPGMRRDVEGVVGACLACQLEGGVFRRRDVLGGHLAPRMPRVAWSLDCAPAIRTHKGEKATILVAVDDFSKFVLLIPLVQLSGTTVAQALLERIFGVYGRPRRVRVDQGREFMGDVRSLLALLEVEVVTTSPLSPWTNGIAERMVRFAKGVVRKALVG